MQHKKSFSKISFLTGLLTIVSLVFTNIPIAQSVVTFEINSVAVDKVDALGNPAEDVRSFGINFSSPAKDIVFGIWNNETDQSFYSKTYDGPISNLYISPGDWTDKLKPNTTYRYSFTANAATTVTGDSSDVFTNQFTTSDFSATNILKISDIQVPYQLIRINKATVTWNTNTPTDNIVYYAETGSENWSWAGTDALSTTHSVEISNLKPFTTYKFYINAKDSQGVVTKSGNQEFTTTYDSVNNLDDETNKINTNAYLLSNDKSDSILEEMSELRNIVNEQNAKIKYLEGLLKEVSVITAKMEKAINSFITYGVDENTKKLGAGERAAVIYSYKEAYKRLPETGEDLADAIKIANGRWPSKTSNEAEKKAKEQFRKIYKRIADMNEPKDNAAITIMAYGLRQKAESRKLESEKSGINTFKNIYGHAPKTTEEWNIMQAITYSGAGRQPDADKDFLPDSRELELGTDPSNPDTDRDSHPDGIEVENGFDPLKK